MAAELSETTGLLANVTTNPPPTYSEAVALSEARQNNYEDTFDPMGLTSQHVSMPPVSQSHAVSDSVVTTQEIVEAFSRINPHKIATDQDIAVIKELVGTMLRYQEEQGVPTTALQKQVTLAKVLQSYQQGSLQSLLNMYTPHLQLSYTSLVHPQLPSTGLGSEQVVRVEHQPLLSQPPDPNRVTIGEWTRSRTQGIDEYGHEIFHERIKYAYTDQIPNAITCMSVFMVICFVVGSPFSLCCTIPGLHWICKVFHVILLCTANHSHWVKSHVHHILYIVSTLSNHRLTMP